MTVRSIHAPQTQFIVNPTASLRSAPPFAQGRLLEARHSWLPCVRGHGTDAGARFLHKKDAPCGTSFLGSVCQFTTPLKVTSVSLFTVYV